MSFESQLIASRYEVFDPHTGALCREDSSLHLYTYMEAETPNTWCFQKFNSAGNLIKEITFQPN
jgi:hypothetical protein